MLLLLLVVIAIAVSQYFKYSKVKRLYRSEYARKIYLKNLRSLLPLMPGCSSKRYKAAENLIIDAGLHISVEEFYLCKVLLSVLGLVILISIQTTNAFIAYDSILKDLNIDRTFMDAGGSPRVEAVNVEKDMFTAIDKAIPKKDIPLAELKNTQNSQMYIQYIETLVRDQWSELQADSTEAARRIYKKLVRIRTLEADYFVYSTSLAMAILLFFIPDIIALIKLKLIEDKRDWEILNYIYVFSIFGRMPPFNIKSVLSNMLAVSDIFRPLVLEVLHEVKSGKGDEAFDRLLNRVDNQELFDLFEAMKLSMDTGLLNIVDNIDEMASNQLKWLEIKSIRRRKAKQVFAMLPVVIVMLLAAVYFSYSLSILSNPMNFIK